MRWDETLKVIQDDRRFNALPSAGERKQVFAEYQTLVRKREKEEEKEKKKRALDDLIDALKGWEGIKKPDARYKDFAMEFFDEDWFKLMDEEARDETFQEFMDEQERNASEVRRKTRKDGVEKVQATFASHDKISIKSKWREVRDIMRDDEAFLSLTKLEALTSWEDWVKETEKKELEAKTRHRVRDGRKMRDAFRELLQEVNDTGLCKMNSQWREVAQHVKDDARYEALIQKSGSSAHDLFDDFVVLLNDRCKDDRNKLKKMAKVRGVTISSVSTFESFHDSLKDEDGYSEIPEEHCRNLFDGLVAKAKEQEEEAEREQKKARKKFVELLQRCKDVTASITYEGTEVLISEDAAWQALEEETRRQCFHIFIEQLKLQAMKEAEGVATGGTGDRDRRRRRGVGEEASDDGGDRRRRGRSEEPLSSPRGDRRKRSRRR